MTPGKCPTPTTLFDPEVRGLMTSVSTMVETSKSVQVMELLWAELQPVLLEGPGALRK